MLQFILLAPLFAAIIAGFGWRIIGETAALALTTGVLFAACVLSWFIFLTFDGVTQHIHILERHRNRSAELIAVEVQIF